MPKEIEIRSGRSVLLRDTGSTEIMLSEDDLSMLLHYLLSMDAALVE